MKYFKQYKEPDAEVEGITKLHAKNMLSAYWEKEFLDDVFENEKKFRLYTPYAHIWTETDDGLVPMAGFIGVIE